MLYLYVCHDMEELLFFSKGTGGALLLGGPWYCSSWIGAPSNETGNPGVIVSVHVEEGDFAYLYYSSIPGI